MRIFEISLFWFTIAPTWYGLAYAIGFLAGYFFVRARLNLPEKKMDILFFSIFLCGILGGRLGYVLFYNLPYFLAHPAEILATWKGGMSFHGGLLGGALWIYLGSKKIGMRFLKASDAIVLIVPFGIFLGRIANYINGELYGFSPYNGPFAMIIDGVPHFPSPLLEASLEGIVLGGILWIIAWRTNQLSLKKESLSDIKNTPSRYEGLLGGIFLSGYAIVRIISEFFRLPDTQIGYFEGNLTLGQILSIPLLLVGIYIICSSLSHVRSNLS